MNKIIRWGIKNNIRGFGFLVKKLFKNGEVIIKTNYESLFYVNPYQKIDHSIIKSGYFDSDVYLALKKHLNEHDVFWDIGANIGLHSITLMKNIKNLNCLAFEPFPISASKFIQNCKLNNLNIPLHAIALGEKIGIKNVFTTPSNLGATGFVEFKSKNSTETDLHVSVFSIDDLVTNFLLESPTVIKIDTEGNELNVLKGAENTLLKGNCRCIVFEANRDIKLINEYLNKFGFDISRLSDAPNYIAIKN